MATKTVSNPHVELALQYAREVTAGRLVVSKYARLACERHLRDLEAVKRKEYPFRFDNDAAERICEFAEMLPHVKGQWASRGELLVLGPWQCFILCCLFGWLRKRDGRRRFRKAYLRIPRKNGKSVLAAVIGLYMFCMDGEHGAEVYSGATSEKQAWEVFRPARQMLDRSPDLLEATGAEVWAKSLVTISDESRFEPVIGKPGDGSSPHCAIADEFHEHETPDQIDTMETGMGAREQPLLLMVTTAGFNLAGPCYDTDLDARRVLENAIQDDTFFAVLYGIDEEDDWASPSVLDKANPNIGVSVDREFLEIQQRQAVMNPVHQNRFKTKHLNVWCSAKTAWMPLHAWEVCGDIGLSLDEFEGETAHFILDLASRDDIAVFAQLFSKRIAREQHYYGFATYYVPESALLDTGNPNSASYRKWAKQGFLTVTDGEEIDFDHIKEDVLRAKKKFRVKEIGFDPWRATHLAQQLTREGALMVEINQTVKNLSAPMKEMMAAVRGGRFHHNCNPVTTWMVANVVAKLDGKDNIYPRKEKPQMKIDGAVALIMGMSRVMVVEPSGIDGWLTDPVLVEVKR